MASDRTTSAQPMPNTLRNPWLAGGKCVGFLQSPASVIHRFIGGRTRTKLAACTRHRGYARAMLKPMFLLPGRIAAVILWQ